MPYVKRGGNGGRRPGAGRKLGSLNREPSARALAHAHVMARVLKHEELTAARVLEEWRRIALLDVRSFFDAENRVKPMSQLTAEQGAALASFEVLIKNAAAGDGHQDTMHKFKIWDKVRVLEHVAKYLGMLREPEITVTVELLLARLDAGRQRIAEGRGLSR